jgi:hypothetical protein
MRDTLRRLLAGEKDINVLLPENYKPHISAVHDGAENVARQTAAA